jgi:hypothetical protein
MLHCRQAAERRGRPSSTELGPCGACSRTLAAAPAASHLTSKLRSQCADAAHFVGGASTVVASQSLTLSKFELSDWVAHIMLCVPAIASHEHLYNGCAL